jgi:8-oxo-dGTP pyrophosphatase MutT (NUDIX family)
LTQVATILVKRQSDNYQLWGRRRDTGLYTTPGGKFEDNENPEQAAARELFEEAGIVASPDQLVKLGVREFPERNLTVHCFVIIVPDSVKPSSANDPDHEVSVWEWLPTMPIDTHAKPNALEPYARPKFTLRKLQTRAPGQVNFTVIQSKIAPTDNNRIFKFIASTNEVDRHGTRLLPRGCQHINFDKNPVFLWNHNKDGLPDDVIGRVLSLDITDSEVIATIEFLTERPDGSRRERAWQCWQDVLAGILKAVSVGFVPLAESPTFKSPEESAKYLAGGGIIDVTQWDLCELSLCPIGSNPDALQVRRLPGVGRFTLSRRDVVDASGHKHAANGQFGSGGSAKAENKPKKKLGNAAEKHSAAAHEAKTHEAHSKAGKAHAAVARAALKRGNIDKATSALAQAKLHRDEAKRLKSGDKSTQTDKPVANSTTPAKELIAGKTKLGEGAARKVYDDGDTVIKVAKNAAARNDNKAEAEFSGKSSLFAKIEEKGPNGEWVRQEKLSPVKGKDSFSDLPKYQREAKQKDAADAEVVKHFGVSEKEASQKFNVTIKDVYGRDATAENKSLLFAAVHEADRPGSVKDLPKSAGKLVDALRQIKKDIPDLDIGDFAYSAQWGVAKDGKIKIADYGFTNAVSDKQIGSLVKNVIKRSWARSMPNDDDDVEPDDSIDLDSEIEELEKLIAQKRYSARLFTIRRVPISSKG